MLNLLLKLKNRPVVLMGLLTLLFILAHTPLLKKEIYLNADYSNAQPFDYEKRGAARGDYDSYLQSALSLLDFEIEKKFNNKFNLIDAKSQQRYIYNTDMPAYAKYILVFYPYPFFRSGYSIIAACLTAWCPQEIFQYNIHRLLFVNIILIVLSLNLFFLIIRKLTNSTVAFIACLFFIFDVSNTYNSYHYLGHTISALFYLLLAGYLFIRSKQITCFKLAVIYFLLLLSVSVLSSPFLILLAVLFGLLIFISTIRKQNKLQVLKYLFSAGCGLFIFPLYVMGVEKIFKFERLGLPTVLSQLQCWLVSDVNLVKTIPVHLRFMWDLRLFNIFAIPIAVIVLLIIVYQKYYCKKESAELKNMFGHWSSWGNYILINKLKLLLYLAIIMSTLLMVLLFMIPISRAMTPYTVLGGILLGIFLGKEFIRGDKIVKSLVGMVIVLLVINFYIYFNIIMTTEYKPAENILIIDEREKISANTIEFAKNGRCDVYDYKIISKTIGEFIEEYDMELKDKEDLFIKFDAMDLVTIYSPEWRFEERLTGKESLITQKNYLKDFRFLVEIFDLYEKKLLLEKDIIRKKKFIFNFSLWVTEHNYIYGYCRQVMKYFKGTPLENLDTHYIYYINYQALKDAFLKNRV